MSRLTSGLLPTSERVDAQAAQEIDQARRARADLEVNLAAIRHNVGVIAKLSPGAKVMAVLKRDAYGLGAQAIARDLEAGGVEAFAVDNVAEGIDLRRSGIGKPIMVIDGDLPDNAALAVQHRLTPGIAQEQLLLAYERAAKQQGVILPIWLVVNVGFNRSGYREREAFRNFLYAARDCQHLTVQTVYAHLTNSNGDALLSLAQVQEYLQALQLAREVLGAQVESSVFASHGLVRWGQQFPTDWVRPGVLLYGEHNFQAGLIERETAEAVKALQPALRMRARVIHLLDFARADGVGYGHHHHVQPGQRLATLSIGFGSGYPYRSTRLTALVRGQRVPVFGDVGMDAMQIDVTGIEGLQLYDWVTLIGTDGAEHISVHELARHADTTPYQLLSGLHVPLRHLDPQTS